MPETPAKFYLTTPIYYVNARPHIGHAYSTIASDVLARRHRLLGDDTFFLTGTDEHGQKVQRSAEAAGIAPQAFTDEVSATFRSLWDRMGITYSDYIRTTEPRHKIGVQKLWREIESRGEIYLDSYTGQYCVSDEAFVDVPVGAPCPTCGRITETITEENYFFRLSNYQDKLIELIESGTLHIQPEGARNEVLSFIRGGLKDLSISRTTFDWGIPVPGNPKHVVYVWLDALANYITAIGYGAEDRPDLTPEQRVQESAKFKKYWPADIHLVGKEITRFHCVYWPAFLLAAGLATPRSIVANGWLLFEESKMSKSRGNVVRTETILDAFGDHYRASIAAHNRKLAGEGRVSDDPRLEKLFAADPDSLAMVRKLEAVVETAGRLLEPTKRDGDLFAADVLRYFLLREIPFGQDGSFSFDALITRYNADLANGYGNLVSRTSAMIQKYFNGVVPEAKEPWLLVGAPSLGPVDLATLAAQGATQTAEVIKAITNTQELGEQFVDARFDQLLLGLAARIKIVDVYLSSHEPWNLAHFVEEDDNKRLIEVLYTAAESIRIITALLYPIMPHTTAKVWAQLGLGSIEEAAQNGELRDLKWGDLKPGTRLGPLAPIFPRADKGLAQIMTDMENPTTPAAPEPAKPASSEPTPEALNAAAPPAAAAAPAAPHVSDQALATSPTISIDDFAKVDLRVAQVVAAERIPKADKLLRLEVDLGPNFNPSRRQILAGIAEYYEPEKLIGRKVVIVANLAPRKMRGLESQGMVVAASVGPDGAPVLAGFLEDVELGARLK